MAKFHLLFSGEINDEFELEVVKKNFKNYFHLTDLQINYIFSGKEIILKKNLTQKKALQFALQFDKLGGISHFVSIAKEIYLPLGIAENRRKRVRRKITERRKHYRAGIITNRRLNIARRKDNPLYDSA